MGTNMIPIALNYIKQLVDLFPSMNLAIVTTTKHTIHLFTCHTTTTNCFHNDGKVWTTIRSFVCSLITDFILFQKGIFICHDCYSTGWTVTILYREDYEMSTLCFLTVSEWINQNECSNYQMTIQLNCPFCREVLSFSPLWFWYWLIQRWELCWSCFQCHYHTIQEHRQNN